MIFVVLGMHKSGTTLVSKILHCSGISMVDNHDEQTDYYSGNKMERNTTLEINHKLLGSSGRRSLDIEVTLQGVEFTDDIRLEMQSLVEKYNSFHSDWGFKDPRTCITYPLWKQVLPPHKIILVYRHPLHTVNHYIRKSRNFIRRCQRAHSALRTWKENNLLLLKILNDTKYDHLVINYSQLLSNDQTLDWISRFIDAPVTDVRNKNASGIRKKLSKGWLTFFDLLSRNRALKIYEQLEQKQNGSNYC